MHRPHLLLQPLNAAHFCCFRQIADPTKYTDRASQNWSGLVWFITGAGKRHWVLKPHGAAPLQRHPTVQNSRTLVPKHASALALVSLRPKPESQMRLVAHVVVCFSHSPSLVTCVRARFSYVRLGPASNAAVVTFSSSLSAASLSLLPPPSPSSLLV